MKQISVILFFFEAHDQHAQAKGAEKQRDAVYSYKGIQVGINAESGSDSEGFMTPIALDTDYAVSIRFIDNQLIFKCDNETLAYTITTPRYLPYGEFRAPQTKLWLDTGFFITFCQNRLPLMGMGIY